MATHTPSIVDAMPLSFQQLASDYAIVDSSQQLPVAHLPYGKRQISIRGFLYKVEEGESVKWVLAKEPNLRTCCVGSQGKRESQLFVEGDFPFSSTALAVAVQGQLKIVHGDSGYSYHLEHAYIPQGEVSGYLWIFLFVVPIVTYLIYLNRAKWGIKMKCAKN